MVDSSENRVSPCLPLGAAWYDTLNFEYLNLDFLVEFMFSETLDSLEAALSFTYHTFVVFLLLA